MGCLWHGFYGYGLKFWLFYGYRLFFFQIRLTKKLKINFFCFKELNITKPVFFLSLKQNKGLRIINLVPRVLSYPSLQSERERDPGWVWSRGHRTKLIPREESFVSQYMNNIFLSGSFSPFIQ